MSQSLKNNKEVSMKILFSHSGVFSRMFFQAEITCGNASKYIYGTSEDFQSSVSIKTRQINKQTSLSRTHSHQVSLGSVQNQAPCYINSTAVVLWT